MKASAKNTKYNLGIISLTSLIIMDPRTSTFASIFLSKKTVISLIFGAVDAASCSTHNLVLILKFFMFSFLRKKNTSKKPCNCFGFNFRNANSLACDTANEHALERHAVNCSQSPMEPMAMNYT